MASGFNNSFEKAFGTGMAVGSNAALETMKEKIKQNEAQRKSDTIADTLSAGIFQKAEAEGRQPTAEEMIALTGIEKLKKAKLEPSEFTTLLKMGSPGLFKDQSPVNVFTVGTGGVTNALTGEKADPNKPLPGGSKIFKEALSPEDITKRTTASEEVKYDYKRKDAFAKIQEEVMAKGVDMTAEEKTKLVSAKQGQKSLGEAQALLQDENFLKLVFQANGGAIGKLSTAGETGLRKYNTAITDTIFNYVFAKSGAQVSDKERRAFEEIYGAKIGDTKEVVEYKASKLQDFFDITEQVMDPNQVAGLTVAETTQRLNEIKSQLKELGASDESSKTILESIKGKAFGGSDDMVTIYSKSGKSKKVSKEEAKKLGVKGV